jgi:hypothetical protein
MDVAKIFGALLSQRAGRSGSSSKVLEQVLNGIAAAKQQQQHPDPRFAPQHHSPFESLVRDSVSRHHRGGGQVPPMASQWMEKTYGRSAPAPTVRNVPRPRHDVDDHRHDHGSGLGRNQRAEILVTAMIMAAQADGKLDAAEQDRIVQQLQPLDRAESDFLRRAFGRRHDVHEFVHSVPNGMEYEVYQVTLMAIDLDTQQEADYLRELAKCLRIAPQVCNQMHQRYNAPLLYR